MKNLLLVGVGGFVGACCRYAVVTYFAKLFPSFPVGVLLANATGSLLAGVFLSVVAYNYGVSLFIMTGFLGAFTTFSAFSIDTVALVDGGKIYTALLNIAMNISISLLCCGVGYYIGKFLVRVYVR